MPDGTVVEMPDQLDPALGSRLRAFQKAHEPAAAEPGMLSKVGSAAGELVNSNPAVGALEKVTQGVTGLGSKIGAGYVGLGHVLLNALGITHGEPADTVRGVEDAGTYQPRTGAAGLIDKGMQAVEKPFDVAAAPIDKAVTSSNSPLVQTAAPAAAEMVSDVAGLLAPGKGITKGAEAASAPSLIEGAAKPSVNDALGTVRSAGYKALPSDVQARMGPKPTMVQNAVEGAGGSALRRDIQLHNQGLTQQLAAQDIGVTPKPKLTPEDYDRARVPHRQTYTDTGNMVDLSKPSAGAQQALSDIVADQTPQGMVQPKIRSQINRVQSAMSTGNYTGPQAIKDISYFRQAGAPEVARVIEDEVGDQLAASGKADQATQLQKFQNARTQFAKIQNYQDATTGGVVDAQDFKRLTEKSPHLLTGNAKMIAQAGGELPELTRLPSAARPASALDKVLGVSKVLTILPKVAEMAGAKIGQSDRFQNRFGRAATPTEQSYMQDFGRRPKLGGAPFDLQAPPGSAVGAPLQRGMDLPEGAPATSPLDLQAPEGAIGEAPARQIGMELAQGRPLSDQKLDLERAASGIEPHQPSLLGHPGTPEGGGRAKKRKAEKRE